MTTYSFLFIFIFAYVVLAFALANPFWPITDLPFGIYQVYVSKKTYTVSYLIKLRGLKKDWLNSYAYKVNELLMLGLVLAYIHKIVVVTILLIFVTLLLIFGYFGVLITTFCGILTIILILKFWIYLYLKFLAAKYDFEYAYVRQYLNL